MQEESWPRSLPSPLPFLVVIAAKSHTGKGPGGGCGVGCLSQGLPGCGPPLCRAALVLRAALAIQTNVSWCLGCALLRGIPPRGWELISPGRNLCRQLSSRGDLAVVVRGWYPSLPLCPHPAGIPSCCSKFSIAPMSAGVVPEASCGFCLTPSLESLPVPFSTPPRTWLWPCKAMRAEEEEEEAVEDVSHGGAALAPLLPALPLLWGSCQERSGAGSCCSTERARGLLRELLVAPTSVSRPWM